MRPSAHQFADAAISSGHRPICQHSVIRRCLRLQLTPGENCQVTFRSSDAPCVQSIRRFAALLWYRRASVVIPVDRSRHHHRGRRMRKLAIPRRCVPVPRRSRVIFISFMFRRRRLPIAREVKYTGSTKCSICQQDICPPCPDAECRCTVSTTASGA